MKEGTLTKLFNYACYEFARDIYSVNEAMARNGYAESKSYLSDPAPARASSSARSSVKSKII